MGTCGYEPIRPQMVKLDYFASRAIKEGAVMAYPRCDRFGEIQTLRTKKDSIYHLIMAARLGKNTVKMDTVSIQCRILNSLADFELYEGANFELQRNLCPLFDPYDRQNTQTLFHINSDKKQSLLAKIIKFDSFRDVKLKQGIYEISLQLSLDQPVLVDHFIMSRGTLNALVMVFKYFECSLLDIMQYRKEAGNYTWTQTEVLFIWQKVLKMYRELRQNSIYHRDIRLSNIYFTSANSTEPLRFLNLSTARRMTSQELKEQDRELLTVRGVSSFAEDLKGHIEAGQELADYDPVRHDLLCLQRVLLSILNLDPFQATKQCKNQLLLTLITQIRQMQSLSELTQVQKTIESLLSGRTANTPDILGLDKEISAQLSKKILQTYYHEQTDKLYLRNLLLMHKRDLFNKYLLEKMEVNEVADKKELNLALLHQIGEYYENIGIADNDYYKEEISLVLDLAKEFRLEHFAQDHQEYIEKAILLIEKYRYRGQPLKIKLKIEILYSCLEAGDINEANQQLVELLTMAHKENTLDLPIQADVLLTKAMVETTVRNWEAAETSLERASIIINEGRNFVTQKEHKKLKGDLLMLQGYHYLRYLKEQKNSVPKPKYIGLAEVSITDALQTLVNLPENPTNTIRIVDTYLLQAGLQIEKERHAEAKKSLDAANLLLEDLSKRKHNVSNQLRRFVYQKLKLVTSPTDHSYPTVCRRLSQLSEGDLPVRDSHSRIVSQLAQSRRHQKQLRLLQKSIILQKQDQNAKE